jgi:hypothetical protein
MAMLAGAVHHRDLPPRQPGQLGVQGRLVGHDDQEAGVVALGVQRVGGDDRTGKVQAVKQRLELGDLVGGGGHLALGEHGAVVVVQRCQQVHLVALAGRTPQRLAVHRDDAAVTQRAQPVGQPRADGGVHRVALLHLGEGHCRHGSKWRYSPPRRLQEVLKVIKPERRRAALRALVDDVEGSDRQMQQRRHACQLPRRLEAPPCGAAVCWQPRGERFSCLTCRCCERRPPRRNWP